MTLARVPLPAIDELDGLPTRDVYRRMLVELASLDPRIYCVDSDMGGLEDVFAQRLPEQYVNLGIAEANMMGVAAGLAAAGKTVFANAISSFAATRACEQVKIDIAANGLPVRIVVTHSGVSAGHYGPTHHALEDIAIMRAMSNMTVVVPSDNVETVLATHAVASLPGPAFVRLGRTATPAVHEAYYDFAIGRAVRVREGDDVAIVATGAYPVTMALEAHERLLGLGVRARVLAVHTVRPIDADALVAAARETAGIVTVEDHVVGGGLGGAVCEVTAETCPCPVRRIGFPDAFFDRVGGERHLLEAAGVSPERIAEAAAGLARGRSGQ